MKYRHPLLGEISVEVVHEDKPCPLCGSIATLTYRRSSPYPKEVTLCADCLKMVKRLSEAKR